MVSAVPTMPPAARMTRASWLSNFVTFAFRSSAVAAAASDSACASEAARCSEDTPLAMSQIFFAAAVSSGGGSPSRPVLCTAFSTPTSFATRSARITEGTFGSSTTAAITSGVSASWFTSSRFFAMKSAGSSFEASAAYFHCAR